MPALTPSIDIQRASERMATRIDWLDSRHSFSFGQHYDPENTHFGLLLVSNHDLIQPDTGFSTHPHRDMEIVTWVLDGELEHKDSVGNVGLIYPGLAQRMSAGSGILHSEINATKNAAVNLVQMWVVPDTEKVRPGYAQLDINAELAKGGLVPVASGRGHEAAAFGFQRGLGHGQVVPGHEAVLLSLVQRLPGGDDAVGYGAKVGLKGHVCLLCCLLKISYYRLISMR